MKRILAIANGVLAAVFLLAPAAVFAAPGAAPGSNNRGDTWLQTVGPCADHNAEVLNHNPGAMGGCNIASTYEPADESLQAHEIGVNEDTKPNHTPHLPCANIEVMVKDLASPSGNYHIDLWPPTGDKVPVYGTDANGHSVVNKAAGMTDADPFFKNGHYSYTAPAGNPSTTYQVADIVDVDVLIHNADIAGAHPHPIQGYHFKLDFNQDEASTDFQNQDLTTNGNQKHKTFWVRCPAPAAPPVVTPPPPATTGSVAGVTYFCENGQQTATGAPGTITIGSVSGSSPQTASGLPVGSTQTVNAQAGSGLHLVNCGHPQDLGSGCAVNGTMSGTATTTVPDSSTSTVCFYEERDTVTPPPTPTGNVAGATYFCDNGKQTAVAAPGTITIGSVSGSSPQTASGLTVGNTQTVNAQAGSGLHLVNCGHPQDLGHGCAVNGTMSGTATTTVPDSSTSTVCFYEQRNTSTPPPGPTSTACVGEEFMLQGTQIVVPGGEVSLTGQANTSTPTVYCNLVVGSTVTGTPVHAPSGYQLVAGTQPITETLVAGTNPEMIYFLNIPQTNPACGNVLGTIVLVGTQTMVPGGTITESGEHPVTTYPSLLGQCQPAGTVAVSATPPPGYTMVGPANTNVTVVDGQVTPVVFQVAPIGSGTQGATNTPAGGGLGAGGNKPANIDHGPFGGVLGAATTMPLTGSEASKKLLISLVCVALGLLSLASTRRLSRDS